MSAKHPAGEHHVKAAERHEHAGRHHRKAAEHHGHHHNSQEENED